MGGGCLDLIKLCPIIWLITSAHDPKHAAEALYKAVELLPEDIETQCLLAETLADAGDFSAAAQEAIGAVKLDSSSPMGFATLAKVSSKSPSLSWLFLGGGG